MLCQDATISTLGCIDFVMQEEPCVIDTIGGSKDSELSETLDTIFREYKMTQILN